MENDNNRKITREKQIVEEGSGKKKTFISEVQEFKKPEGYNDAFKEYYPEQE
ncbi:hypothetical protein [Clostridium sp.]|uniref:hypothetical protein n=1 Tax=Clostridium sp. TaxID=1506 RepID=UPI001A390DAF|nr:hypothetical protein [Clostridium sp.]MBK5236846.1 hypothetical protein [Clostridium sp.]